MEIYQSYFEENKASWNKRTAIHKDCAFYDLDFINFINAFSHLQF